VTEFHAGILPRLVGEGGVTFYEGPWYWNLSGFLLRGGRRVAWLGFELAGGEKMDQFAVGG
jgi:hypothetical protein